MPLSCLSSVVMGIVVCQSPDTVSITQGTPYTHSLHIQHISLVPGVHKAVINSGYHIQVSFSWNTLAFLWSISIIMALSFNFCMLVFVSVLIH